MRGNFRWPWQFRKIDELLAARDEAAAVADAAAAAAVADAAADAAAEPSAKAAEAAVVPQ
ncbi:hypothetical protein CHLRE_10g435000v5 [Chlamydomonas reinhardtii]|uniref:Uncharacterized protein n=1 Tax=Chlamydomonas reinhardtii TaxID=3055 RepID=A0A2K3DA43_CHLRE|nr:uncharacterized protein CHLRE_10g435000v5 [Chlamydomonas reinhardtii]PNW77403.1 hypothetical protein CHLRE_10g435000v5 [Chlamydomonas reinhardtii]